MRFTCKIDMESKLHNYALREALALRMRKLLASTGRGFTLTNFGI